MSDDQEPVDPSAPHGERAEDLSDELARKYDPDRLLRLVSTRAGKGESLDHSVRAKYERRFGVDLGHVRVYTGEFAEEFNKQRDAYAVTIGSTGMILMGGSPDKSMASRGGEALLAHELTHVAQARGGLHRSSTGDQAMPFTQEHEVEAEAVESEVAAGGDGSAPAAPTAPKESKEEQLEKVRARVLEMAADAVRTFHWRNGVQRRA